MSFDIRATALFPMPTPARAGMFDKDAFHGDGTYYYAGGDVYSGAWARGVKQGEGSFLFAADSAQIVGSWLKNACVAGKWIWADGTVWAGPFSEGRPLGRGVFFFASSGTKQEGEYVLQPPEEGEAEDAPMRLVWHGGEVEATDAGAADLLLAPRVVPPVAAVAAH